MYSNLPGACQESSNQSVQRTLYYFINEQSSKTILSNRSKPYAKIHVLTSLSQWELPSVVHLAAWIFQK